MDHYLFDFDRNGEIDAFERAAEFQFLDECFSSDNDCDDYFDDDTFFDDDF